MGNRGLVVRWWVGRVVWVDEVGVGQQVPQGPALRLPVPSPAAGAFFAPCPAPAPAPTPAPRPCPLTLPLQGLFHPARSVREVYWRLYNNLYIGAQVGAGARLACRCRCCRRCLPAPRPLHWVPSTAGAQCRGSSLSGCASHPCHPFTLLPCRLPWWLSTPGWRTTPSTHTTGTSWTSSSEARRLALPPRRRLVAAAVSPQAALPLRPWACQMGG